MNIAILGGGAAGFFAAISCKTHHPDANVVLIEKSSAVLSKVKISGGGRCNVTHACFEPRLLSENYPRGGKALLGPFHQFGPTDTMAWFEERGVKLKIEPDNRVFPVSDSSQTIIDCLIKTAEELGIKIWMECGVESISSATLLSHTPPSGHPSQEGNNSPSVKGWMPKADGVGRFHLTLQNSKTHAFDRLILATGSGRQGYQLAQSLGHRIVPPVPSLFTFAIPDSALTALSGLSVQNTRVQIPAVKGLIQEGPILITHWGLSGPAIIKLSAWGARHLHEVGYHAPLHVRWLGQHSVDRIQSELQEYRATNPKKTVSAHSLFSQIPSRLWAYLVQKSNIPENQTWQSVAKSQLTSLTNTLHADTFQITGKGQFKEEFVTCGGIILDEVNFKTMESKRCPGLYFVGEILDIDGITGGFNFQNAWTTGWLSGKMSE